MTGETACRNDECGTVAWPQMTLNSKGKIAPACPKCGLEHLDVSVEDFQAGKPVDADRKALPDVAIAPAGPRQAVLDANPHLHLHHSSPSHHPKPLHATYGPQPDGPWQTFDPIAACRDRLTFLTGEDARFEGVIADARARLAGIRVEAKKLSKMLSAAARVIVDHSHHQ